MYIQVTEHQAGELDHILQNFERWSDPTQLDMSFQEWGLTELKYA
jgi:hypothetical protein